MASPPKRLRPRLTIPTSPRGPQQRANGYLNHAERILAPVTASAASISPAAMPSPIVHTIPDSSTRSATYVVVEPVTEEGVVINPILDFDAQTNRISTKFADSILQLVEGEGYIITHILETGIHCRHISACRYVQDMLAKVSGRTPRVCIGRNLHTTRGDLSPEKTSFERTPFDKDSFDNLFADGEKFRIGNMVGEVMYLSAKAGTFSAALSEMVGYVIGDNIFASIPDGLASLSEESRQRLLNGFAHSNVYGLALDPSQTSTAPVTIGTLTEHLEATALQIQEPSPSPTTSGRATMHFYATEINARGGRIPKKINLVSPHADENAKQKRLIPRPLLIPKKLEMLLC